jgi:hypothetical protein
LNETQGEKLGDFRKNISIKGGSGKGPVEILFQNASNNDKLDQLSIIGQSKYVK